MNSSTSDALFDDACAYDNAVKSTCQEKYSEFAEVMSDYRDGRIDPGGVKARVHELFKGHKHLILGINNIMPKNYEIILPPSDEKVNRQDATTFLKQVKVVFQDKMEKYYEFLQVIHDYMNLTIDILDVIEIGMKLFKGHVDLLSGFNYFLPERYQITYPLLHDHKQGHQLVIKDAFLNEVKAVFHDKLEKYFEFLQLITDHKAQGIDTRGVVAIVKELFKEHRNLILGFNAFLPEEHRITLPFELHCHETGKRRIVAANYELSWDVLDIISKSLDFDDLFQFACVCKNWRAFHKMYWRNFLALQEPLLVQKSSFFKKSFSFISIPNQKVYRSKMINYFWHFAYSGSSSGYLIMTGNNNSFLLMNPFTRRKKVINTSTFKVNFSYFAYRVLLAFDKGSKDFVLVALCKSSNSLHVYQSRNFGWVTYSTMGYPWMIVDFVVLHNTIYVVNDKANIGILNLNSANIKFLEMKCIPSVTSLSHLRLVSCDEQLFVVHTKPGVVFNVYKIDFSTMKYVKLKTLGDIALLYAPGGNYYALSNPNRWGYESNSVYVLDRSSTKCRVYVGDDNKLPKYIRPHEDLHIMRPYWLDWSFRHLHYEIDYSLAD